MSSSILIQALVTPEHHGATRIPIIHQVRQRLQMAPSGWLRPFRVAKNKPRSAPSQNKSTCCERVERDSAQGDLEVQYFVVNIVSDAENSDSKAEKPVC